MFHFEGLQEDNPRQVDLIRTDLDVALTLVQVARQTREGAKASRSRRNARKAYDAIIRYVGGADLTRSEQIDITRKLALLKSGLLSLGELI